MALFSLVELKASFGDVSLAPDVNGYFSAGGNEGVGRGDEFRPGRLAVPWILQPGSMRILDLLNWRVALSDFEGRDEEISDLLSWAEDDRPILARFVIGEGGTGKTRLAAELAELLRKRGWAAGFVPLRDPVAVFTHKAGTLLVVDYPEANMTGLKTLLEELAVNEDRDSRIRVLFLTRHSIERWQRAIVPSRLSPAFDWSRPLELGPVEADDAAAIFNTTVSNAMELLATPQPARQPPLAPLDAVEAWLEMAPEHGRTLFIAAAAVHSVLEPESLLLQYTAPQIVTSLVRRELQRVAEISRDQGFEPGVFGRLRALATLCDGLDRDQLIELPQDHGIEIQGTIANWDKLTESGLVRNQRIQPQEPDLLGAALVAEVKRSHVHEEQFAAWLRGAATRGGLHALEHLLRLSYDAHSVLKLPGAHFLNDLGDAIRATPDLYVHLNESITNLEAEWQMTPSLLARLSVQAGMTTLEFTRDETKRASLLNNLSIRLNAVGEAREALKAIQEAVEIRRRLSEQEPARYEPDLAMSLNNLSNRLEAVGEAREALKAVQEAVGIRKRLSEQEPARYEPDLANSLNNLSSVLEAVGEAREALKAIQESVGIRKRLSEQEPARYEPDLASSLINLSNRLYSVGEAREALKAIQEAVEIYKKVSEQEPGRYEPDLAMSLNNLSSVLNAEGEARDALKAIQEAVEIYEKLSEQEPARYEPDLAMSLNNLSSVLEAVGEAREALKAIQEAVEIYKKVSEQEPARYEPDLAMSLSNLSSVLNAEGEAREALKAIQEAVEIYKRLSEQEPARYEPDLAMSLNNLSVILEALGERRAASEAANQAAAVGKRITE